MGPPTAELSKGQWNLGFNYTYSTQDLDTTTAKLVRTGEDPTTFHLKTKDFNVHRYYVAVGYGLAEWWEVYGQLGIADLKADFSGDTAGAPWNDGVNFDDDFAWGLGTRFTLAEQGKVKWGLSAQMNWLDTNWDDNVGANTKLKYSVETFDLLVAVGPTIDMGGWKLYGGPFYYYLNGDYKYTNVSPGSLWKETADLEADSNFGGFIGAQFALSESVDLATEISSTSDGWAFGTGIGWKF